MKRNKRQFKITTEKFKKQIENTQKTFEEYQLAKREFEELEFNELNTTNFKELYGANNDKIRKEHIKEKFEEEYNKMKKLENKLLTEERLCDYYKIKSYGLLKIL